SVHYCKLCIKSRLRSCSCGIRYCVDCLSSEIKKKCAHCSVDMCHYCVITCGTCKLRLCKTCNKREEHNLQCFQCHNCKRKAGQLETCQGCDKKICYTCRFYNMCIHGRCHHCGGTESAGK